MQEEEWVTPEQFIEEEIMKLIKYDHDIDLKGVEIREGRIHDDAVATFIKLSRKSGDWADAIEYNYSVRVGSVASATHLTQAALVLADKIRRQQPPREAF